MIRIEFSQGQGTGRRPRHWVEHEPDMPGALVRVRQIRDGLNEEGAVYPLVSARLGDREAIVNAIRLGQDPPYRRILDRAGIQALR